MSQWLQKGYFFLFIYQDFQKDEFADDIFIQA